MLQKMQYILVRQKLQLAMHFRVLFRNPEIRNDRFGFVCFERKGSNMKYVSIKNTSEGDLLVPFLCAAVHVIFPFSPHPTVAPFLSIRLILQ